MANSIPLTASSTLSNVTTAETLSVGVHENNGTTGANAPILIDLPASAAVDAETFAAELPSMGGQGTEAQARLAINATAAALEELVDTYGAVTVNTPMGTVSTYVEGSIENASDAVDPTTNVAYLGLQVPESYRKQIAEISTYVPITTCPASLKRIRDKATGAQSIDGTNEFYLEGKGMTFGGTGETLQLLNAVTKAKVCDVTVSDHTSKIQFVCKLNPESTVAKGSYVLRLVTLGGGESTLWTLDKKVTLSADAVKA